MDFATVRILNGFTTSTKSQRALPTQLTLCVSPVHFSKSAPLPGKKMESGAFGVEFIGTAQGGQTITVTPTSQKNGGVNSVREYYNKRKMFSETVQRVFDTGMKKCPYPGFIVDFVGYQDYVALRIYRDNLEDYSEPQKVSLAEWLFQLARDITEATDVRCYVEGREALPNAGGTTQRH